MHEFAPVILNANRLILDERAYNIDNLRETVERDSARLNADQKIAFDALCQAVASGEGGVFFLEGFGGTGKTFLINLVLAKIRCEGIALATASSGIAATLLDGGTTAHSRFKIPIDINSDSTCHIPAQSHLAELIRETQLVFWDEAPMQHRHTFEAVNRTFKDIRNDPRPFGGVVFCFCGDFRQILPVVPRGTRGQIVSACLKRSPLWQHVQHLPLTINMRLFSSHMSPEERLRQDEFANRILAIGEGRDTNNEITQWPLNGIVPDNTPESLANAIYPTLTDRNAPLPTAQYLAERAILAARNDTVDKLNEQLLTSMNGEVFTSYSADKVVDEENAETYATEYLNTVNLSNLPPHELKLKIGATVILLRNLSPSTGLCNGTRLRVARISQRVVECEILGGKYAGNMVMIPRIPLSPSSTEDLPFDFRRTQFPLRLAFAMTINKAQGQTLNHVGLCLKEPVFTHGQLYVALSRVTDSANLRMIVPDTEEGRQGKIKNVVYSEVFN
jgi:PIF1-like helicase/Helicase